MEDYKWLVFCIREFKWNIFVGSTSDSCYMGQGQGIAWIILFKFILLFNIFYPLLFINVTLSKMAEFIEINQ